MRQAARLFQACLRHERIHIALDATWMNRSFSVTSDLCDTSSVSKGSEMEVRTNPISPIRPVQTSRTAILPDRCHTAFLHWISTDCWSAFPKVQWESLSPQSPCFTRSSFRGCNELSIMQWISDTSWKIFKLCFWLVHRWNLPPTFENDQTLNIALYVSLTIYSPVQQKQPRCCCVCWMKWWPVAFWYNEVDPPFCMSLSRISFGRQAFQTPMTWFAQLLP